MSVHLNQIRHTQRDVEWECELEGQEEEFTEWQKEIKHSHT